MFKDDDGRWCLDYFPAMMSGLQKLAVDAKQWGERKLREIDETIQRLEQAGQYREAANWRYMRAKMGAAVATW